VQQDETQRSLFISEQKKGRQMDDPMLTNEVAIVLRRSPAMIRKYERDGLLPAKRTETGTRIFQRTDVEKLAQELNAKKASKH
jgi:hypothetical protein